jgi:CRISPR/Cas system CMR subunit Cmr6 (Cas7 group RAMP superfamily)
VRYVLKSNFLIFLNTGKIKISTIFTHALIKCSIIKNEKTCRLKYNKPHQNMVDEIKEKIISTKIKRGLMSYNSDNFESYRKTVDNYTNRNKKLLYEQWDRL